MKAKLKVDSIDLVYTIDNTPELKKAIKDGADRIRKDLMSGNPKRVARANRRLEFVEQSAK